MTPTEFDLRSALRDGEGDGPDVDRVVAGGQARRAQRRVRLLSTAAVVAFVAAAGVGGAVLVNRGGGGQSGDSGGAALAPSRHTSVDANGGRVTDKVPAAPASAAGSGAADGKTSAKAAGVACPATLPRRLLPGGGSPGQFGADGPLFTDPVTSLVVCSYGSPVRASEQVTPGRLVLDGANATELARSLENADTTRSSSPCPTIRYATARSLAIIGVTARGTAMTPVTTTLSQPACNTVVTNGTAVRYNWSPPANLAPILDSLTPRPVGSVTVPNISSSGKNIGSPVR